MRTNKQKRFLLGDRLPKFGTFTNGPYKIKGFIFFGTLYGKVIESYYPMVYDIGQYVSLPEYHLPTDKKPQFYKV